MTNPLKLPSTTEITLTNPKFTSGIYCKSSPYAKSITAKYNPITYSVSLVPTPTNVQCYYAGGIGQIPVESFNSLCESWLTSQGYTVCKPTCGV